MSYGPTLTLGRILNPPEARPDRRFVRVPITHGLCDACGRKYSSEKMKLGMNHKGCTASPAGRFRRP